MNCTGFTEGIINGEITSATDYLKRCARSYWWFMRDTPSDEPIPEMIKFEDYYNKGKLDESIAELEKIKMMSDKEISKKIDNRYFKCQDYIKSYNKEVEEHNSKLKNMASQVEQWEAHTKELRELKEFALNQIELSMEKLYPEEYSNTPFTYQNHGSPFTKDEINQARNDMIESAEQAVDYYSKKYKERLEFVNDYNQWIKDFKDSLKQFESEDIFSKCISHKIPKYKSYK